MNIRIRYVLLCGALVWLLSLGTTFAYRSDGNAYPPLQYSGFLADRAGDAYTDAIFDTPVKRVSDAVRAPSAAGGGYLDFVMTEYSTMSPFSQDGSRLILQHVGYYGLYDGAGTFLKNLPFEISASSEPRWSRTASRVLYYVRGNQLKRYDVDSGAMSVVHTFSEYAGISGRGESDISFDGDHFVFVGDNRYIFTYRISTDSKSAVLDTGGRGFDSIYITPDNNVTVTWLQAGGARYNGIELFDSSMRFQRQLTWAGGHMDVGRDTNGDEVLLWANAADPVPVCNNGVVKVRLSDARQTCLAEFDWNLALNVSAPDQSGWVFVATYAPGDPDPMSGSWPAYTNEIVQVKLDGSEVRRLAHHRSRPLNGYNYTPRPAVSRDGTKVAFSSNFGMQESGYPTEYADAYLIDLGAGSSAAPVAAAPSSAPALVGPAGSIADTTPVYGWDTVSGATQYQLHLIESGVGSLYASVHDASGICSGGSCALGTPPVTTLKAGASYVWRVRARNSAGTGPWSDYVSFSTEGAVSVPATPSPSGPSGSITDTTPVYGFSAVAGATQYQLHVIESGVGAVHSSLYDASAICSGGSCNIGSPPVATLSAGASYVWRVRARNSAGSGPWSGYTSFSVVGGVPAVPTLIGPTGTIAGTTPAYQWNAVTGATRYQLHIIRSGVGSVHSVVYEAPDVCSGSICTVGAASVMPPPELEASASYVFRVRGINAAGSGQWSPFASFSVQ